MAHSIKELDDYLLARLILRQLEQIQSAGGVSAGRSTRSLMLEAVLRLMPIPNDFDPDSFHQHDLIEEAITRLRGSLEYPLQIPLFTELEWQSNEVLIFLILGHMRQRYESMAENVAATDDWSFSFETPIMSTAWILLMPREDFSPALMQLPYLDLINLANCRSSQRYRLEEDEYFGINKLGP
ncbi:MAG: hypothetical protein WCT26_00955 [Candidatus Buchananbacteria bacterium]|jgi:hypothetical protein